MRRTMARHEFDTNEFKKRLSDATKEWIGNDVAAKLMYDELIWHARHATAWYNEAENNPEITRWVPQGGGGDCFIVVVGDSEAEATRTLRFLLPAYARKMGRNDIADNISRAAEVAYAVADLDE